jgi:predicted nucleic acid-binding protein
MRIIVDANIVFSGILNSEGKIGDLLINGDKQLMLGLKAKGFKNIISTDDLYKIRLKRLKKQKRIHLI